MTIAGTKTDAVTERPLGLRRRPDLLIQPHHYGPEQYWLVKDPVAARYFHLAAEEHAILSMLDGRISLGQLKHRFEEDLRTAANHLRTALFIPGTPARPGPASGRRLRPGRATLAASGRTPAAEPPGGPGQCPGDSLSRRRSRSAAPLALSQVPLDLLALVPCDLPGLGGRRHRPGFLPVQRLAGEAARLSRLHHPAEHRLALRGPGPGQDRPRAGPCPDVHACRRPVPRDRPAPAGLHPLPLLRRLRRMVDRGQMAADRRLGGRHPRRGLPGGRGHVSLVVQLSRARSIRSACIS